MARPTLDFPRRPVHVPPRVMRFAGWNFRISLPSTRENSQDLLEISSSPSFSPAGNPHARAAKARWAQCPSRRDGPGQRRARSRRRKTRILPRPSSACLNVLRRTSVRCACAEKEVAHACARMRASVCMCVNSDGLRLLVCLTCADANHALQPRKTQRSAS